MSETESPVRDTAGRREGVSGTLGIPRENRPLVVLFAILVVGGNLRQSPRVR